MKQVSNERFKCKIPGCKEEFWGPTGLMRHMEKLHERCEKCGGMFTKIKRHWANGRCQPVKNVETGDKL